MSADTKRATAIYARLSSGDLTTLFRARFGPASAGAGLAEAGMIEALSTIPSTMVELRNLMNLMENLAEKRGWDLSQWSEIEDARFVLGEDGVPRPPTVSAEAPDAGSSPPTALSAPETKG